jgi:TRAP-type mannitol/chloroaromatic compound transport system substrate-binding protein
VVAEIADKDDFSKRTYTSYQKFLTQAKEWSAISELAYLQARDQIGA